MGVLLLPVIAGGLLAAQPRVKTPRISGDYIHIYQPAGDVYPGPSEGELEAGRFYAEWVPNDHGFIKGEDGTWHLFGITHPRTSLQNIHLGEYQSFHAVAPAGPLREGLRAGAWQDRPKVLAAAERPGEIRAQHAPHLVRREGLFHMIYGPTPLRTATSADLVTWTPRGALAGAPEGRDPSLLSCQGTNFLLVCGRADVRAATSTDMQTWQSHPPLLTLTNGVDPESPTLVRAHGTFYLFVCGWNGVWDRQDLQGAYQHVTYVYQSDDPLHFDLQHEVARLDAHAPEIIQDERGDWYISSAEWPHSGVSVAPLAWE